jgi:hypothetical protein
MVISINVRLGQLERSGIREGVLIATGNAEGDERENAVGEISTRLS